MLGPGTQLLNEYSPIAAGFLGILIPIFEPVGWASAEPGTLLGYKYSTAAIIAIAVSALLGLLVSLSTFLVIGATSSLTYNVVGHIKTVIILMGGCMFFGDEMPAKKLGGISIAMGGIIWYSQVHPAAHCWSPGCRSDDACTQTDSYMHAARHWAHAWPSM